jgi:hypothetical protein
MTVGLSLTVASPHIVFTNPSYCWPLYISWKLPFTSQSWGKRGTSLIVSEGRAWGMVVATMRNNRPR